MNGRIFKLAGQAISKVPAPLDFHHKHFLFAEKFAELIVRECLSIVDDAERGGSNEVWDNAVKFIRKDLKEHFGVK